MRFTICVALGIALNVPLIWATSTWPFAQALALSFIVWFVTTYALLLVSFWIFPEKRAWWRDDEQIKS